jgi:transposase
MRPYREYTPDQAFLLPPALSDLLPEEDPVFLLREILQNRLDLSAFHERYRCERGQPPYHPALMVGLFFYGGMQRVYSSRRLAQACVRDVGFMVLTGGARPDHHTIGEFRQRFTEELAQLFVQVLGLCQEAGLVRLGHISLDGTKLRANASRHKAMSYGRMLSKEEVLEAELRRWLEEGMRQDAEEDEEHGPDDDGWSLPDEAEMKVVRRKLEHIQAGKARLETMFREKAEAEGRDPDTVQVPERAQTNFTDPESRIMKTQEGFQQCYNAQAAVDGESQVIVAYNLTNQSPDVQQLRPILQEIHDLTGRYPDQFTADAGYASEANFAALDEAGVHAVIALRRYHRDEPPDADPAPARASNRWPHRNEMRRRLMTAEGKALYRLRKR